MAYISCSQIRCEPRLKNRGEHCQDNNYREQKKKGTIMHKNQNLVIMKNHLVHLQCNEEMRLETVAT